MKFTQNTPVISPNTIGNVAVRVSGDPMAYGTGGKEYGAMAGAIGQIAKVAQQEQDDKDAADTMEARNRIMSSLTESMYGEKGILTTGIGENAKGLQGRVHDTVQKTFDNISKGYNSRVQRALRGNLSENMGNFLRIAANQEGREFRKQKESQYGITIDNSVNRAMLNYQDVDLLDSNINDVMNIVDYRAKDQGFSEMQRQQERRRVLTAVVTGAMQAAIDNGNLDTASIYADRYGKYMDQGELMKYQKVLRQEKRLTDEKNEIEELTKKYVTASGEPDWNRIEQEIKIRAKQTKVVGGGSNDRFVRIAQETAAIIRQKYPDASPNLEKYLYGQMMRETGWGKDPAALEYNNFAGLHGGAKGRKYADDHDYAKDYASFFTDGYHTQAIYATDGTDFARRLSNKLDGGSGWYEDRNYQGYGQTIMEAMADYDKKSAAGGVEPYQMPTQGANIDAQVGELKSGWAEQLPLIGGVLHSMGLDGVISSAARSAKHNAEVGGSPTSHHINHGQGGDALDIVLPDGTTKADAEKVLAKFKETGAFDEVLFHDAGSGYHLHLGGLKGSLAGQGGSGGHTVNVHDSGYEDRMIRRLEAARSDWMRRKKDEATNRLQGYQSQIQNAGSAANALSILERIKSSEQDPDVYSAAIRTARTYYPDAFKESNNITGTRRSRSSGSNKVTGESGEKYTMAQIRKAKSTMQRYWNDEKITDAEQEKYDNAANILKDVGLGGDGDNLDEPKAFTLAKEVWNQTQDYAKAHKWLRDVYGFTYNEATYYLDNME